MVQAGSKTVRPQLRAMDPERFREALGKTMKSRSVNKRNLPLLRPRRNTADSPQRRMFLSLPFFALLNRLERQGLADHGSSFFIYLSSFKERKTENKPELIKPVPENGSHCGSNERLFPHWERRGLLG